MEQQLVSVEVDIDDELLTKLKELTQCDDNAKAVALAARGFLRIRAEMERNQQARDDERTSPKDG